MHVLKKRKKNSNNNNNNNKRNVKSNSFVYAHTTALQMGK